MTATDQDFETERAVQWLAREARKICPPSLLANPRRWAEDRIAELRAEHWRCMRPDPKLTRAIGAGDGTPPTDEFKAVKAAITARTEDHE